MPPPVILDPASIDLSKVVASRDDIMAVNPHRFEFQLLDAVVHVDLENRIFAGYHDVRPDGWWVRGHIPERPLFPGVLMIEAAAQLASYLSESVLKTGRFLGFAGVDGVKFRGVITPPARFLVVGRALELRARRTVCEMQGFVDNTMVFEAVITGMTV